jgi:hypothetical protein
MTVIDRVRAQSDAAVRAKLLCLSADIVFNDLETQSQILGLIHNMIEEIEAGYEQRNSNDNN